MSLLDPDDLEPLEKLWNLPSPGEGDRTDYADERTQRNAMYEYCYAKRDHLQHHLGEGERMLKAVFDDIERLHEEERKERGNDKKSLRRRITDRRKR